MKRLLGFLIGLLLSVALAYAVRRWLSSNAPQPQPSLPPRAPEPTPPAPTAERSTNRYTVRTTGPRPQAPVSAEPTLTTENEGRNAEPEAAINTDAALASPRSETTEPAILSDTPIEAPHDNANASEVADFMIIIDVGPVFNQKLHAAGIKTFGELAALTPAEIEEKTDIPASRVERGNWIKQAARLAEGLSPEE